MASHPNVRFGTGIGVYDAPFHLKTLLLAGLPLASHAEAMSYSFMDLGYIETDSDVRTLRAEIGRYFAVALTSIV